MDWTSNSEEYWTEVEREIEDLLEAIAEEFGWEIGELFGKNQMEGALVNHNLTCVSTHCQEEVGACVEDIVCQANFDCQATCDATDYFCIDLCHESYKSKPWDTLMQCMYESNDCSQMPQPSETPESFTCRLNDDNVRLSSLDPWLLAETWFVTHGYNSEFDCFACQKFTFRYDWAFAGEVTVDAVYDLIAMNGTRIWNDNWLDGKEVAPGHLRLQGRDNGFQTVQDWYFLMLKEDTAVAYYCGATGNHQWDGVVVLRTFPDLSMTRHDQVNAVLEERIGITLDDMCDLKPKKACEDAPRPFTPYEMRGAIA